MFVIHSMAIHPIAVVISLKTKYFNLMVVLDEKSKAQHKEDSSSGTMNICTKCNGNLSGN